MAKPYSGKFAPRNPAKYKGDFKAIVYRSLLERNFFVYCDENPAILQWWSEELAIPYRDPFTSKRRRYYPDCYIKVRKADGTIEESLIEIKPSNKTREPKTRVRATRKYIKEVMDWGVNSRKWEAAAAYCKKQGWTWRIITEKDINGH